ncbi:hypothetical protein ABGY98_001906 [Salmonella enterica]|uniref:Transposase n=2 Tax=Salmonella diarizonae TaxID=59204 RepID=A0A726URJ1_SALDZ|nr:hypothetical protein DOE59_09920 [Salmonella enterica subsp. diarizonae serovar 48:i:z]EAA4449954.1 hypothetical protein [Salmonella enterica subsp. diarizonae]EAM2673329.1 hypothetical protein [Salmonella enterica]EAW2472428.1 hypothetical protein [Salmonella enterica subsp. enterica]EBQ4835854.1 hypothetical protein [Salmonella enterica subsp. arizonae]ECS6770785.1 hypothetical protein [Salmonella enterica subsp. diarizonae serovar 65:z10:e,n,x,z15]EDR1381407.1 hypothetical protein [Salm
MSKAFTHHIERHNLNLRIHIKRLARISRDNMNPMYTP